METPEESETRGHFDAVWMKAGGEGREERRGSKTGGGGDTKTQRATKPLPAGTQVRMVPLFRWIEPRTMWGNRGPPCPCLSPALSIPSSPLLPSLLSLSFSAIFSIYFFSLCSLHSTSHFQLSPTEKAQRKKVD